MGITCQRVIEVEVMADAGLDEILITYRIVGKSKLNGLAQLVKRCRWSQLMHLARLVHGSNGIILGGLMTYPPMEDQSLVSSWLKTPEMHLSRIIYLATASVVAVPPICGVPTTCRLELNTVRNKNAYEYYHYYCRH